MRLTMVLIGELALWLALVHATWGATASALGAVREHSSLVRSGARGLGAAALMSLLAIGGMLFALVQRDFELTYVAAQSSRDLPLPFAIAALWSAPAGATLLLAAPLAAIGALLAGGRQSSLSPWLAALLSLAVVACLAPLCFSNALFARLAAVPPDGAGLAPPLQRAILIVHPPLVAVGVSLVAPFLARAIGELLARSSDQALCATTVRLGVFGWLLLGVAILLALRDAYRDPTWWESWRWRPLRDGSLLAWLLVGVALGVERAGARLARWSGAASVLAIAALVTAVSLAPIGLLAAWGDDARIRGGALLLAGTVGLAVVALRESAVRATVGTALRGVWVLRVGFAIAATGLVLTIVAIVALRGRVEHDVSLETGQPVALRDPRGTAWTLTGQGVSSYQSRNRDVSALALALSRGAGAQALLTAERWQLLDRHGHTIGEPVAAAGVHSTATMDLRLLLGDHESDVAAVRLAFEPMAQLLWIGGALLLLGGALAFWEPR